MNGVWKLDPTNKFYPIRNGAVVEVRMNPSTGATVGYPPASINCSAFPPFEFPTLALTGAAGVAAWIVGSGIFLLFGVIFVAAARRKSGPPQRLRILRAPRSGGTNVPHSLRHSRTGCLSLCMSPH